MEPFTPPPGGVIANPNTIQGQATLMAKQAQRGRALVGMPWLDLIMLFVPLLLELLNCSDDTPSQETGRKVKRLVSNTYRNGRHNAVLVSLASRAAGRVTKNELGQALNADQEREAAIIALDGVMNAEEETVRLCCADGHAMLAARQG